MPSVRQIWWAKLRVLVVAAVAAAILIILLYLLTGGTLLEAKATLYLYIPDASGVEVGAPVRVDGIGVGKVSDVALSGSNQPAHVVRVTMRIERSHLISIPSDSTADVGTETLLGDKFIGIKSGSSADHLQPGGVISVKPEASTLDLQQFAKQLRDVDAVLKSIEDGSSPLGQFVLGEDMYNDLLRRTGQILRGMREMENTTSQIGAMVLSDKLIRQVEAPLRSLDQTLARIQSGQGPMGELLRDSAQYDSLRSAFVDLRRSVSDFQSGDMMQSDALYRQWNRSIETLIQQVDETNASPLFSTSAVYDNMNGFARELGKSVREFRENPRKFLRLKLF